MEVAGLIIGIVGVVLAIVVLPGWTRPKLDIEPDDFTGPEGRILLIKIKNLSSPRWAQRLGLERKTGQVQASFDIQEQGTNKFVARAVPGMVHSAPLRQAGTVMPIHPGFSVGVVVLSIGTKNPGKDLPGYVDARRGDSVTSIAPGWYRLKAAIICGEQVRVFSREFKVGRLPHELFWV